MALEKHKLSRLIFTKTLSVFVLSVKKFKIEAPLKSTEGVHRSTLEGDFKPPANKEIGFFHEQRLILRVKRVSFLFISLFFFTACFSKGNLKHLSDSEKLDSLRSKLLEMQNNVENLRTENLILKKILKQKKNQKGGVYKKNKQSSNNVSQAHKRKTPLKNRDHNKTKDKDLNKKFDKTPQNQKTSLTTRHPDKQVDHTFASPLKTPKNLLNSHSDLREEMLSELKDRRKRNINENEVEMFLNDLKEDAPHSSQSSSSFKNNTARSPWISSTSQNAKDKKENKKKFKNHLKTYIKARKAYKESNLNKLKILSSLALEHFPNGQYTDDILFQLGRVYIKKDLYKEAIYTFDQILKIYPGSNRMASILFWKGVAYQRMKMTKPATSTFQQLIAEHPESLEAYLAERKVEKTKNSSL